MARAYQTAGFCGILILAVAGFVGFKSGISSGRSTCAKIVPTRDVARDLVALRVGDVAHGKSLLHRAIVLQRKTQRPVQFEVTEPTRAALAAWIERAGLHNDDYLFPSRRHDSPHLSTRQYARIVERWVFSIGLDPAEYGTHTLRRTKATLIYKRTKNLRAVQLLLGHTKLESTVRYLGIEVDDALEIAEQIEV